jgi:hypothetical protein
MEAVFDGGGLRREDWNRYAAASVLQASGFRRDVTMFRLNARSRPKTGSEPAFRRNTAACVCTIEAAHNPEVAGSNPAPATAKRPRKRGFSFTTPGSRRDSWMTGEELLERLWQYLRTAPGA